MISATRSSSGDQRVRGGVAGAGGEGARGCWTATTLSMPPGPPMAATRGARVSVLPFDQAQADQSPVLIHPLDRVAVQLQLADHGCWGVKPSRAQRGKRHRLLTSTTQLLKRQTMLSLNERHRTGVSPLRPADPGSSRSDRRFSARGARSRHSEPYRALVMATAASGTEGDPKLANVTGTPADYDSGADTANGCRRAYANGSLVLPSAVGTLFMHLDRGGWRAARGSRLRPAMIEPGHAGALRRARTIARVHRASVQVHP
jgi:hypothetical protein